MEIDLDVENKQLEGQTQLTWKNTSSDTISYLLFHMYYNAFKNANSTFFQEREVPEFLTYGIDEDCNWAWTSITHIADENGNALIDASEYIQTDDRNSYDQTVLKVPLKKPLLSGEQATFTFNWKAKIPKTMPRTGYNKDFYFFAQWFPKVGVYEPVGTRYAKKGKWNCHQYHSDGEYYADFGSYDVKISVPADYLVASSGQLVSQEKKGNKKIWNYKVDDVIDFAWGCSPHFVMQEDSYKDTKIKFYTYPYKADLAERYFATIKYCMAYMEEHVGAYPYSTLTIIDPPIHGMYTGGMEYPTLITSLSFDFFPDGFKTPETLVVHEYIHQYFMQMIATHEVEEPWMDEGFTTYWEGRVLDAYLGSKTSTIDQWGITIGNREYNRGEFMGMKNPMIASNARKSWQYKHGGYGPISYNKTGVWLMTLEGMLGTPLFDEIMKAYFDRWKFKHPARQDFIYIVNELVAQKASDRFPEGMDWYFDQVLSGTGMCDYSVASITVKPTTGKRGIYGDDSNCQTIDPVKEEFVSTVIMYRLEEVKIPVTIKVMFSDGSSKLYEWDGQERSSEIVITSPLKIVSAEIDPERKIYLDKNFLNNTLSVEKSNSSVRKIMVQWVTKFQHFLETISIVI